ncbi:MAG: 30S ribosomal protein S4 [Planctomycetota bacterium]|nr:30S ribosomal protein S4 [Planctomycetota bacterium]
MTRSLANRLFAASSTTRVYDACVPFHLGNSTRSAGKDGGLFMARYTGPKLKLSRRVGAPVVDTPKHTSKRQLVYPGMHGYRGRRRGDYGIRMAEKQKLKYHYGVLEKQFRRYVEAAGGRPGDTGVVLLQMLERRLDNVIRRAGLSRTVWGARQLVAHGHVRVNGRKVDRPSYNLRVGDVITLKEKVHKLCREAMESMAGHEVAEWIQFVPAELTIRIVALPTMDQIPFDVNANLIIEFYR